ncbi:MAG: DoxX family protein [Bacteroidetes bacterium]|nr:DoxX family protein [Bacteroidota bacterium]
MTSENIMTKAAGMFFIRSLLAIIFLMQGYGKIFSIGIAKVYDMFFKSFETSFLPKWLIVSTAYYTSYSEFICGILLLAGLFQKFAMYFLAVDLLIVSFGHGLMEPIWDLSHVMPRAILLAALFLLPRNWDTWSIDSFIQNR